MMPTESAVCDKTPSSVSVGQFPLSLEQEEHQCEADAGGQCAEPQVDSEGEPERYAEQGGVGHGIPEIGHLAPDDETPDGARDHGDADSAHESSEHEILHQASPRE